MAPIEKALTVYDTYIRSERGPSMTEPVWDNKVIPDAALRVKEEFELSFGEDLIPTDRDLMDRLFRAGLEMLVSTGIFNVDTGKVVMVTEDEVMAAIRNAPKRIQMGANNDMVVMEPRRGNPKRKPIIQGGPTGATVSEEIFVPMFQSYAQEPVVDTIVNGVMGRPDMAI